MTRQELSLLCAYTDRFEAETIRNRLALAGIQAAMVGTDAATALGMGGAPPSRLVRIEVRREDLQQAQQILAEDKRRAALSETWRCADCGEVNEATFDLCWNCGSELSSSTVTSSNATDSVPPPNPITAPAAAAAGLPDGNPYRPVVVGDLAAAPPDQNPHPSEDLAQEVRRAFFAAVIGWFVVPPLPSLYSIYCLLRLPALLPHRPALRYGVLAAWCLNLMSIIAWPLLYFAILW
jgi:hypothetical protein